MGNPQIPIDFTAAMEARDLGVERSVNHANRVESEWSGQALGLLIAFAMSIGRPFLVEEARAYAEATGLPPPPDKRAWGSIPRRARAKRRLEVCGSGAAASSNCSLKRLWRYVATPTQGDTQ